MERKSLYLEIKSAGSTDGPGYLEGYGAYKGNIDSYGDVIRDGAFKGLEEFIVSGFMGEAHAWDKAVGYIEEAREDDKGLWVKMAFHSTPDAQSLRTKVSERLAAGKSVGLSIGYFTRESENGQINGQDVRFLNSIEVFEVSVVTMPANDQAKVLAAKGHSEPRAKQFQDLTAQVEDYIQRLHEIKEKGANDERLAKFRDELSAVAALCLDAIGELEAKTNQAEFDSFPDGWMDVLTRAEQLTK